MIRCQINLLFHPERIRLVKRAPRTPFGLFMALKQRATLLKQFPLVPTLSIPTIIEIVAVIAGKIDGDDFGWNAHGLRVVFLCSVNWKNRVEGLQSE